MLLKTLGLSRRQEEHGDSHAWSLIFRYELLFIKFHRVLGKRVVTKKDIVLNGPKMTSTILRKRWPTKGVSCRGPKLNIPESIMCVRRKEQVRD